MNFRLFLIALAVWLFAISGVPGVHSRSFLQGPAKEPNVVHQLWNVQFSPMLQRSVQSDSEAYNDGELLMVPLHAAFRRGDEAWERSFSDHFARAVENPYVTRAGILSRLQYLYLASEFIVIAKQNGHEELIPAGLPDLLFSEVQANWKIRPAWQWEGAGRPTFPGGIRERLLWKLNSRRVEKSYYRAIIDEDLFLFAIAADLKAYGGTQAQQRGWNSTLGDVLLLAYKTFSQEVVPQPGAGWLMQQGVWTDHPDYKFAGNREARSGIQAAPVRGISEDSSHSLRFPLWLTSQMRAYTVNSDQYRFYAGLRDGLDRQFFSKVLVRPTSDFPCYRTNNFMDGSNGVYRWSYGSFGNENGYGPYGVSGALLVGWWSFLDTDRMRAVYRDLATQFPWPRQCVELYLGPSPTHQHPASAFDPQSPAMRLWHILVLLASEP